MWHQVERHFTSNTNPQDGIIKITEESAITKGPAVEGEELKY